MKILILTDNLDETCGWGRYSYSVVKRLKKYKNIKIKVLVNRLSGKNFEKKIFKDKYNFFDYFKVIFVLRKIMKEFDVIHCFDGYPYAIVSCLANFGLNKKIIINGVGTYSVLYLNKGLRGFLLKKSYKKANAILCISNYVKGKILNHFYKLKNIKVVHLGVNIKAFNISLRKKINFSPIIISVGALKYRKGQHISIKAIKILKEKYPNIILNIIGVKDELYYNKLVELVEKYRLQKNINFFSHISDEELLNFYKKADIFLMPSITTGDTFEGFGLVFLEANICGLPVIGTYNCGAEDAIKNGYNGYLVSQNNSREVAEKIIKIFSDNDLYQKMSRNAVDWAKKFSWDKTVDLYVEEYKKILR